jgi:hypothetical protein
MAESGRQRIVT